MRFSTLFSTASALVFAASAMAQVINPTFSEGLTGWSVSDGSLVTATVHNGISVLQIGSAVSTGTETTTTPGRRAVSTITINQDVPGLAAGTNYKVTFSYTIEYADTNPEGEQPQVVVIANQKASDENTSVSGVVNSVSTVFTSVDGTDTISLTITQGAYTIYVTEVIIQPVATGSQAATSRKKRELAARLAEPQTLCPAALTACPITFAGLVEGGSQVALSTGAIDSEYECLDVQTELNSCGGCSSTGKGVDCEALPFIGDVQCVLGSCIVYSCETGYNPSANLTMCEIAA